MATTNFYTGIIGDVYAAAVADQHFVEDDVFAGLVAGAGGTALELGSGTGRLLLRLLAAGHDVEGLEVSPAMIDVCRAEARRRGLDPVVHLGSFAPLNASLRGYAAIYCPLNAFSFIVDDDAAEAAVRSYVAALRPGGVLALAGSAGDGALHAGTGWVRRADVPVGDTRHAEVQERRVERIIRIVDEDGTVIEIEHGTQLRRLRPMAELAAMYARAGLVALHGHGNDADHILTGRKG
jgi:SAM-dependent methyltransferase